MISEPRPGDDPDTSAVIFRGSLPVNGLTRSRALGADEKTKDSSAKERRWRTPISRTPLAIIAITVRRGQPQQEASMPTGSGRGDIRVVVDRVISQPGAKIVRHGTHADLPDAPLGLGSRRSAASTLAASTSSIAATSRLSIS